MKSAHSAEKKPTDELVKIFTWKAARKLRAEAKNKDEEEEKRGGGRGEAAAGTGGVGWGYGDADVRYVKMKIVLCCAVCA